MVRVLAGKCQLLLLLMLISGCGITMGTRMPSSKPEPLVTHHTVRKGENLYRISLYYYEGKDLAEVRKGIEKIRETNGIVGDQLSLGQRLVIPDTKKKQPEYALIPPPSPGTPATPVKSPPPEPPVRREPPRPPEPAPVPEGTTEKPPSILKGEFFLWPVTGRIICRFREMDNNGLDILVKPGSPVRASRDGTVIFSGVTSKYGKTVIIEHPDDFRTVYSHDVDGLAARGTVVKQGDVIGTVMTTDTQKQRYLHFEIRKGADPVDPLIFLPAPREP